MKFKFVINVCQIINLTQSMTNLKIICLFLDMLFVLVLGLLAFALYKMVISPWKQIDFYVKACQSLGYKVYKPPFSIVGMFIMKNWQSRKDPYFLEKNQFHNYDIIIDHIFGTMFIAFINIELVAQMYAIDKNYLHVRAHGVATLVSQIMGDGFTFNQGEKWKRKRRVISQVFSYDFIKQTIPQIKETCEKYFIEMEKSNQFPLKYIKPVVNNIFAQVLTQSFFGKQVLHQKINGMTIVQLVNLLSENVGQILLCPQIHILGRKSIYFRHRKVLRQTCRKKHDYNAKCLQFVKAKMEKFLRSKRGQSKQGVDDKNLVNQIMKYNQSLKNQQQKYTTQQIADQFGLLFFAASDTSTHFIMMMLYYLDLNPQYKQKLLREVDSIIKSNEDITFSNLQKLQYLQCIQKQTLRVYPPVPGLIQRQAIKTYKHKDIPILKGTNLGVTYYSLNYNPKLFTEPHTFNPDRWEDKKLQKSLPAFALGDFGGGPRSCIGKTFALLQNKIILVKFIRRYNYEMMQKDLRWKWGLFLEPQKIYLKLEKKQNA